MHLDGWRAGGDAGHILPLLLPRVSSSGWSSSVRAGVAAHRVCSAGSGVSLLLSLRSERKVSPLVGEVVLSITEQNKRLLLCSC